MRKNCPTLDFRVYTLNMDVGIPNYIAYYKEIKNEKIGKYTREQIFCTNARAILIPALMEEYNTVVWIDADSIIRNKMDGFYEHVLSCDFTARYRNDEDRFYAAVIMMKSNIKNVALAYKKIVEKDECWTSNQTGLHAIYKQYGNVVNFKSLPEEYCSVSNSDDAVIWVAKKKNHGSEKWLRECEKYAKLQ